MADSELMDLLTYSTRFIHASGYAQAPAEVRAALDKVNNHLTMHIYYALRDAYVELGKDMHWASETADEIWSDARAILFAEFYRRWREHPTPDRPQFPSHHGQ